MRDISSHSSPEDEPLERSLRPQTLEGFIGQTQVRHMLAVAVKASTLRQEAMDHALFYGPPGLGKTTLAQIIAREMGTTLHVTSGPVIAKGGDLAALLTNLKPMDVLFIDEIHRLNAAIEEILYPAMEDFRLDLIIGAGPSARSVRLTLPPFTLVAATTRAGLITTPLRERFGLLLHMDFYTQKDLTTIIMNNARALALSLTWEVASDIALRSRGTPRVAGRLLRRVRDFATVMKQGGSIDTELAQHAFRQLDIDDMGLDALDRRYLEVLATQYEGGPVGLQSLAMTLANERDVLEDVVEPFLVQKGLVHRTLRGRLLTSKGWECSGVSRSLALPFPHEGQEK